MNDARPLQGKRALVTGGSRGIGSAVVARLLEDGAGVMTTARARPECLPEGVSFVAADVTTAEGGGAIAGAVLDLFGGVDIIVHVVGGSSAPAGGFAVLEDDEWQR